MTTPIPSHFPVSVLSAIFLSFCGDEPVHLPLTADDKRHILRLVCTRWNAIVLSTHALWAAAFFLPPDSHYPSPGVVLTQFFLCTTRSGNNPLTVTFDMGRNDWPFSIVHSIVLPHIHRIRYLTCPILSNADIVAFLTIPGGQFMALESVNIAFANTWTRPISWLPLHLSQQFGVFDAAPRLRAITAHVHNGLRLSELYLPWGRLTSINLGSTVLTPEGFVKFACHAALQLEDAVFHIKFTKSSFPGRVLSFDEITMHRLRTLRLRLVFPSHDTRIFSSFRFPVLASLCLQIHDVYKDWNVSLYATFLRASSPTLRQLWITEFPSLGFECGYRALRHLEALFAVIPNVNILRLPLGLYVQIPTMERLASCELLPQLRMLELGCTVDGARRMFSVLAERREHALNILFNLPAGPRPSLIQRLRIAIPNHHYSQEEGQVLNQQKELLESFGMAVDVAAPNVLPLSAFH